MDRKKYDLAIIGGGPAGYSAAFEAAKYNMSCVLFEKDKLGGTCLHRGCVPTKYLNKVAGMYKEVQTCESYGIKINRDDTNIDFVETKKREAEIVDKLAHDLEKNLLAHSIDIVYAEAYIEKDVIKTVSGDEYEASKIIIATGGEPADISSDMEINVADAPGKMMTDVADAPAKMMTNSENISVAGVINTNQLLEMREIPEKLTILGGGVTAVEFAYIYATLGSKVTIFIRGKALLRNWDKDIVTAVTQSLKKAGVVINTKTDFSKLSIAGDEVVLSALGRKPVLPKGYGENADDKIVVVGDARKDSTMLAHVAMAEGRAAVREMVATSCSDKMGCYTSCIFVDKEVASVGLTEAEAIEVGIEAISCRYVMYSNARVLISDDGRSFIKLVADKNTKKLIGAQLYCDRAGDMVAELATVIDNEIDIAKAAAVIRPHPSYCEDITAAFDMLLEKL
ncbi:MAG: NAD(P)/FAD-dependent oxidoreductase [Lachnospiraceae bacterium]|nr:NAD(P)/FAD-dependent oxidoreductase [Lachnospiraceae bacterium]